MKKLFHLSPFTALAHFTYHLSPMHGNPNLSHQNAKYEPYYPYHFDTFHLSLRHFSLPPHTNFANSPKIPLTSILRTDNMHLVATTRPPPSEWQRTSEMNRHPKTKGLIFIPSAPSQLNRDDYNTQTITLSAWERTSASARVLPLNEEFDPGSGRTLAACLIHASRTHPSG